MGSMIERMNGVQDRSTVPVPKRRKIAEDDGGDAHRFKSHDGGSSSGMLSGYLEEKKRADQPMPTSLTGKKTPVLDLTAGTFCDTLPYSQTLTSE